MIVSQFSVAQSFTLLYRRLAVGSACAEFSVFDPAGALQTQSLRYSRAKLCATRKTSASEQNGTIPRCARLQHDRSRDMAQ